MPAIIGAVANRQPARPVSGYRVWLLGRLKSRWRRFPLFRIVTFIEFAATYHTGGAIVFPGWCAFAEYNPVRAWNDLIADETVAVVIARKQTDDFLHEHGSFLFRAPL